MSFDPMLQRQIMGRFATGVTVITSRFGEEVSGLDCYPTAGPGQTSPQD